MGRNFIQDQIITEFINGNNLAFEKLFKFYYPRLNKYACYFLENSAEAEDLVQDVFFQIWKNRKSLKKEKHFSAFIFTLVKNRCLNLLKRKVVEEKYVISQAYQESEELYYLSFEGDDIFLSMEQSLSIELEKIIQDMPERCSLAFRLKWIEGKKIREIADLMKISTTMVDKHLAKGLQIARNNLSSELFLFLFVTKA